MLVALVLAAGLIAAGCGDDDDYHHHDSSDAHDDRGHRRDRSHRRRGRRAAERGGVRQAGQRDLRRGKQDAPGQRPESQEHEEFATDTFVPAVEAALADIRALTPPEGEEAGLPRSSIRRRGRSTTSTRTRASWRVRAGWRGSLRGGRQARELTTGSRSALA